jgi:phosphatidylinositol-3-phosphatase
VAGDNADDFNHTIGEIVISPDAHPNINGLPYASPLNYTHSSDLRTMQEIFNVGPYLGDAANALDLSDLFVAGAIPNGFTFIAAVPEPPLLSMFGFGLGALAFFLRRQ